MSFWDKIVKNLRFQPLSIRKKEREIRLTFEVLNHELLGLAWFSRIVCKRRALVKVISVSRKIRFSLRLSHRGTSVFDASRNKNCLLFLVRVKIQFTLQRIGACLTRSVLDSVAQSPLLPWSAVFRHVCFSFVCVRPRR